MLTNKKKIPWIKPGDKLAVAPIDPDQRIGLDSANLTLVEFSRRHDILSERQKRRARAVAVLWKTS